MHFVITVLSIIATLVLAVVLLPLAIAPVLDARTVQAAQSISHTGPAWEEDETILVPPNTRILPLSGTERYGIRYLKAKSEYGEIYVPWDSVSVSQLDTPYKTRLAWILGWNLLLDEGDTLRVCFDGSCYAWVRSYTAFLSEDGSDYTFVWKYLASGWVLVFMMLMFVRFGRYDMTSESHLKAIVGSFAVLITMGLANLLLWVLLLVDRASFVGALAGVGANVFFMGIVTIRCRDRSEETIWHKVASICAATAVMGFLSGYVGSNLTLWETVLLVSPAGILFALLEAVVCRVFLEG